MKKIIYLTFMLIPLFSISQVKEHRVASNKIHQVADGRMELAALQLGVVGNNYFNEIKIGDCAALRQTLRPNWYPIDGYKRTVVSKRLLSVYTKNDGGALEVEDKDMNLQVIDDNDRIGNYTLEAGKTIYCEIDLLPSTKLLIAKYSDNIPKYQIDKVAAFGPFVNDSWHSNIEIHPAEQIWWQEKRKDENIYHLYSFMDASDWFDGTTDFESGVPGLSSLCTTHEPWITNPMSFVYAIPFETKLKKSVIEYSIDKIGSNCAVVNSRIEKQHKLFFGGQLIATVQEPTGSDILDISFDNVGLDPYKVLQGDTVLQGFVIIKSKTNNDLCPGDGGDVLLKITKRNRVDTDPVSVRPPAKEEYKVKVTLDNIVCISEDDGNENNEEIYGYIGVKAISPDNPEINILPNGKNSPLLWSKLDENHLVLTEGIPKNIGSSSVYSLKKSDKITLVADLEENDAQWDNNNTTRDINDGATGAVNEVIGQINPFSNREEEDDKLEAEHDGNNSDGGKMELGVVFKPISIKDLSLNQLITRKMYFGSGGTKIEVSFKIELIQKTDAGGPIRTVDRAQ